MIINSNKIHSTRITQNREKIIQNFPALEFDISKPQTSGYLYETISGNNYYVGAAGGIDTLNNIITNTDLTINIPTLGLLKTGKACALLLCTYYYLGSGGTIEFKHSANTAKLSIGTTNDIATDATDTATIADSKSILTPYSIGLLLTSGTSNELKAWTATLAGGFVVDGTAASGTPGDLNIEIALNQFRIDGTGGVFNLANLQLFQFKVVPPTSLIKDAVAFNMADISTASTLYTGIYPGFANMT